MYPADTLQIQHISVHKWEIKRSGEAPLFELFDIQIYVSNKCLPVCISIVLHHFELK